MTEQRPLSRTQLDKIPCNECGTVHGPGEAHDDFVLQGRCHPGPVLAKYRDGVLTLTCSTCDALVIELYIAWTRPPNERRSQRSEES